MLIWSILAVPAADPGAEGSDSLWVIAVWGAVLVGIVAALGIGVAYARRKYLESREVGGEDGHGGLAIDQVESLHDGGRISDEEFRVLRKVALGLEDVVKKKDNSSLSDVSASDDDSRGAGEENQCADADKEQE